MVEGGQSVSEILVRINTNMKSSLGLDLLPHQFGLSIFYHYSYQFSVFAGIQKLSCMLTQSCSTFVTHRLQPTRLFFPWEFLGNNIGVGCHFFLQGIFLTQESNMHFLCLLHGQVDSLPLSHLGSLELSYSFKKCDKHWLDIGKAKLDKLFCLISEN